jgi:hypothetical protein
MLSVDGLVRNAVCEPRPGKAALRGRVAVRGAPRGARDTPPPSGGAGGPLARVLAAEQPRLARQADAESLEQPDAESAVDAGVLAGAEAAKEAGKVDVPVVWERARTVTSEVVKATTPLKGQAAEPASYDYSRLGTVIPVLPGSPGAGASVVATVLADALQSQSWRVLLADTADPARSGLAFATHFGRAGRRRST